MPEEHALLGGAGDGARPEVDLEQLLTLRRIGDVGVAEHAVGAVLTRAAVVLVGRGLLVGEVDLPGDRGDALGAEVHFAIGRELATDVAILPHAEARRLRLHLAVRGLVGRHRRAGRVPEGAEARDLGPDEVAVTGGIADARDPDRGVDAQDRVGGHRIATATATATAGGARDRRQHRRGHHRAAGGGKERTSREREALVDDELVLGGCAGRSSSWLIGSAPG